MNRKPIELVDYPFCKSYFAIFTSYRFMANDKSVGKSNILFSNQILFTF